ncbi:rhodanese-like domain-containing protein [Accumulibacter sp.]|uniref:rhodanese-like domain-containing protein n=1 Tax=Accumulibacter sp. TaxID=2053492 RepID=UPI0025DFFE76|nr:rhodanese-like domain-containing protein [Accumulibacter sp.]MCM8625335.1 rhodanese-like domain-containing protein [Accumulibacter sp.]
MEFIQQNILLVAVAVVSGSLFLVLSFRRPGGARAVSPTEATMLINRENAQLIDIREPNEYVAGHLCDSRNIPAGSIEERAGELETFRDRPLILVCQSGARSSAACAKLVKLGFSRVHTLDGGVAAWSEAGLPLRKGARR